MTPAANELTWTHHWDDPDFMNWVKNYRENVNARTRHWQDAYSMDYIDGSSHLKDKPAQCNGTHGEWKPYGFIFGDEMHMDSTNQGRTYMDLAADRDDYAEAMDANTPVVMTFEFEDMNDKDSEVVDIIIPDSFPRF